MTEPTNLRPDLILAPPAPVDEPDIQQPPCAITLLNGKTFVVKEFDAWTYVPQGVFATGAWKGTSTERNLLISGDRIDFIELDYSTLKAQQAAA